MRVLLVDDEQDHRFLLRYWIDDACDDVVIEEASNGLEAVDMVKETAPDFVVMDLRMPVMGGLEATRKIKEVAPDADVVVYSATTLSDLTVIKEAGATDQFMKGDIEGLCRYLCPESE